MLVLGACSTQRAIDVIPEVRVERFTVPPDMRSCAFPEGLTAGQTTADIGRDLVTVTAAFVTCDAMHGRLVAALEHR